MPRPVDAERTQLDIDELFASEPEAAPAMPHRGALPTLIFTQPADRNVQQFADEPAQFADEAQPVAVPPLFQAAAPYHASWNEPEPGARRSGLLLGGMGVVFAIAVLASVLLPRDGRNDLGADAAAGAGVALAATPLEPRSAQPPSDENIGAAPSRTVVRAPDRAGPTPRPAAVAGRPTATSGRTTPEPPISAAGLTSRSPAAAPPPPSVPDLGRSGADTGPVVGQPLAAPPLALAAVEASDAAPVARAELPAVAPVPASGVAATAAAAPPVDPRAIDRDRVRAVLSGYERAYSALDANAASRVFPGVDRKGLARAFSGLSAQEIQFDDCRIQVLSASARATCAGTARWTPKVGGGRQQQARRWQFDLQPVAGGWQIASVKVQ